PVAPMLLVGVLFLLLALAYRRSAWLASRRTAGERWVRYFHGAEALELKAACAGLRRAVEQMLPTDGRSWSALLLLLLLGIGLFVHIAPSTERIDLQHLRSRAVAFEWILRLGLAGAFVGLLWAAQRIVVIWSAMSRVTDGLQNHPILTAFDRMSPSVTRSIEERAANRFWLWAPRRPPSDIALQSL